jgi:hypothetical protein
MHAVVHNLCACSGAILTFHSAKYLVSVLARSTVAPLSLRPCLPFSGDCSVSTIRSMPQYLSPCTPFESTSLTPHRKLCRLDEPSRDCRIARQSPRIGVTRGRCPLPGTRGRGTETSDDETCWNPASSSYALPSTFDSTHDHPPLVMHHHPGQSSDPEDRSSLR